MSLSNGIPAVDTEIEESVCETTEMEDLSGTPWASRPRGRGVDAQNAFFENAFFENAFSKNAFFEKF